MRSHQWLLSVLLLACLGSQMGCSTNAVEGVVQRVGDRMPVSGVRVVAKTHTDIKEEQKWAVRSASTDADGRFVIKGLLPFKDYQVTVDDPNFESPKILKIYVKAPERGTKIIADPIGVCPIPPGDGVWFYSEGSSEAKRVQQNIIGVKEIPNLISYGGFIGPAHYVRLKDTEGRFSSLPRKGLLIMRNSGVLAIGALFHITATSLMSNKGRMEIPEGFYYNISSFHSEEDWATRKVSVKPHVAIPNLPRIWNSPEPFLWAYDLAQFNPGLYMFTTRRDRVGGWPGFFQYSPREGFLVRIE